MKKRERVKRLSKPLVKKDDETRDVEVGMKMAGQKQRRGGVHEDIVV